MQRTNWRIHFFFTPSLTQERLIPEPRLRRNVYTMSMRPRRAVPSMLRQESRVKLRRDSNISSICKVRRQNHHITLLYSLLH